MDRWQGTHIIQFLNRKNRRHLCTVCILGFTTKHTWELIRNNVRLRERQVFSCKHRFVSVKNGSPQKACNPSCLHTDLQWKINKEEYEGENGCLKKSRVLMFCCRSMTPPSELSLSLYLALSLAVGRHWCHIQSKHISHHRTVSRWQVQIFKLATHLKILRPILSPICIPEYSRFKTCRKQFFCPKILYCVVSLWLFNCFRSRRSVPVLKS